MKNPRQVWNAEPVRVFLNGIGAVVNAVLLALVATKALDWQPVQTTAVVTAVQMTAGLLGEVLRAFVSPKGNP